MFLATMSSKPSDQKKQFWSRRKLLAAIASVSAVILLAGLLVWFSAPKNELLAEMPTQQSRLRFLGPLQQPVSDAWQRFRKAWLKSPKMIRIDCRTIRDPAVILSGLGSPVLTNQSGLSVWILDSEETKKARSQYTARNELLGNDGILSWSVVRGRLVRFRPTQTSRNALALDIVVENGRTVALPQGGLATFGDAPTNHPALFPFGARVVIPKGSSAVLLGPATDFNPSLRFSVLLLPL